MIEWLTITNFTLAVVAGLIAVISGIRGTEPRDLTVLATLAVSALVLVQGIVAVVQPMVGNAPQGDPLEFWMYAVTAFLMPVLVTVWAFIDRTRFATVGLGVVSLAVAVMFVRMSVIWAGN